MTPTDRAAELLRLRERATAGPWEKEAGIRNEKFGVVTELFPVVPGVAACVLDEQDADFIAYAANHAAAIVAEQGREIERLRKEVESLKSLLRHERTILGVAANAIARTQARMAEALTELTDASS